MSFVLDRSHYPHPDRRRHRAAQQTKGLASSRASAITRRSGSARGGSMSRSRLEELERVARRIRRHVVLMTHRAKSSHVGTSLSSADVLAVLYGGVLRIDPADPDWPDRDRFILSKGHGCAGLYAVLAECGFFPLERLGE